MRLSGKDLDRWSDGYFHRQDDARGFYTSEVQVSISATSRRATDFQRHLGHVDRRTQEPSVRSGAAKVVGVMDRDEVVFVSTNVA